MHVRNSSVLFSTHAFADESPLPDREAIVRCREPWTLERCCVDNGRVCRRHPVPRAVEEPSIHAVQEAACVRTYR